MHNYNRIEKIQAGLAKLHTDLSSTLVKFDTDEERDASGRWTSNNSPSSERATHDLLVSRHDRVTANLNSQGQGLRAKAMSMIRDSIESGHASAIAGDAAHAAGDEHKASIFHAQASNSYQDASFGYAHMANSIASYAQNTSLPSEKASQYDTANSLMNLQNVADELASNVGRNADLESMHDVTKRRAFIAARIDRIIKGFNIENYEPSATTHNIPNESMTWLDSQIKSGGHSAIVAQEIIASLTAETEKARRTPKSKQIPYSLPDSMRARKHTFYPPAE